MEGIETPTITIRQNLQQVNEVYSQLVAQKQELQTMNDILNNF